jgi:3-isopropylmalate/(R)-2-methylmalate dehydratase small subunit
MTKVFWTFGDDISTDIIYPGRYMATVLPSETPQYAFDDIKDLNKMLVNKEFPEDDVIVAGKNFGTGSSREQAVSTLKGYDLVIIAKSFARIFYQNSINLGLRIIICPDIEAKQGDAIEIANGKVINKTSGKKFEITPHSKTRQEIIDAGGLIAYTRNRLMKNMA